MNRIEQLRENEFNLLPPEISELWTYLHKAMAVISTELEAIDLQWDKRYGLGDDAVIDDLIKAKLREHNEALEEWKEIIK